jgi:aspartyl-tRNA(Asn)/glutamyl-tRNA(Gln) amidotransferase subunit A
VPRDGAFPLSWSLDSVGPLARSVACCAIIDAVLAGETPDVPAEPPLEGLRLAVPRSYLLDGLDATVSEAFDDALDRLAQAGAKVEDRALPILNRIPALNARGGLVTAEAYARHRELLEQAGDRYDPRVRGRILRGAQQSAAEYIELTHARAALMAETDALTADVDALVLPTVAIAPPRFDELEDDEAYTRTNLLVLRNTSAFNFLERPAVSIPCHCGGLPVGLMVVGARGRDRRLLGVARAVETAVA